MPTIRCVHCGKNVRVKGLAALCPSCGQLVSAAEPDPAALDGFENDGEAQIAPPVHQAKRSGDIDPVKVAFIIGGAFIGLVVLILGIQAVSRMMNSGAPPAVVKTTPAPRPAPIDTGPTGLFDNGPIGPADEPPPTAQKRVIPPPTPTTRDQRSDYARLVPATSPSYVGRMTDEKIGEAIQRGVEFLISKVPIGQKPEFDASDDDVRDGKYALVLFAFLHAGTAIDDKRLTVDGAQVKDMFRQVKTHPMAGNYAVYARSLRLTALCFFNRAEDLPTIKDDLAYLTASCVEGGFNYNKPPPNSDPRYTGWDNAHSEYGMLGLWAAAEQGYGVAASLWQQVENHWINDQETDGSWSYLIKGDRRNKPELTMTAAGLTALFVARQQISKDAAMPTPPTWTNAVERALKWLGQGDTVIRLPGDHSGNALYGLERAGLASGYKFFGDHDWFLENLGPCVKSQTPDGSWNGFDGPIAETALNILFLSRGRHPIFVTKLRHDGAWANRPLDVTWLTIFASQQLERAFNFQIVDLNRGWQELTDSPVLFITSDTRPPLTDTQFDALRNYVQAGGLIFTHAEKGSKEFNEFAAELAAKVAPDRTFETIPRTHPIYNIALPTAPDASLMGVSNGSRLLVVHSPTDLTRQWSRRATAGGKTSLGLASNVVIYGSGKRDFHNRIDSPFVPEVKDPSIGTVPVARLTYSGEWDPEPFAWTRFSRLFQQQTSIKLDVKAIAVNALKYDDAPFAHLTGIAAHEFTDAEISALRAYVSKGGLLLVDSVGAKNEFEKSFRDSVLPRISPNAKIETLGTSHPTFNGTLPGTDKMSRIRPRQFVIERDGLKAHPLYSASLEHGQIILSDLDLTSGLLGTNTWGIYGYESADTCVFMKNLILWGIHGD